MRTSSRPLALLLFDEVELLDFAGLLQTVTLAGRKWNFRPFKVHPVATAVGRIWTRSQLSVEARFDFAGCPRPEIVVLPGGYGARRAADDEAVQDWLRQVAPDCETVAAVGAGALIAARAGLAEDEPVAVSQSLAELVLDAEARARVDTEARLCRGRQLLTASSPAAGIELGLVLVERALGKKQAVSVARELGYPWREADAAPGVTIIES